MNQDEHARIKSIFMRAIELPDDQRSPFVQDACGADAQLLQQVQSLLRHHRAETLLPSPAASPTPMHSPAKSFMVSDAALGHSQAGEPGSTLVLAQLWNENRALLQLRLRIFAATIGVVVGYAIVARVLEDAPAWAVAVRSLGLLIVIACLWRLGRQWQTSLWQMRLLELILTTTVGSLMVLIDLQEMHALSRTGDLPIISAAATWNYVVWALFILTYGIFIPNTWRRAAILLLPMASIPYAVDAFAAWLFPTVDAALRSDPFGRPLPLTFIAAGISIAAANVIHGARLSAFRAKRLAQYELLREIGSGGMGTVYEARHLMLKRPCAVKIIQPNYAQDPLQLQSFEHEVQATCSLTHPHTIEIFDYGQTNEGLFFYVMELLPGVNLRDLVKQAGPLPTARTVHFLRQICGALSEAHARELIHRDIKPANIFVAERGGIYDFAKLLDFGLVRQRGQPLLAELPKGFYTAGTPDYMSPEQFVNYENIDGRSDIYSLGAVAYYMLTGQPPFPRDHPADVIVAHAQATLVQPMALNAEISADVNDIVSRCLEKSPADRFQSIDGLQRALDACSVADLWDAHMAKDWWREAQSQADKLTV